MRNYRQYFWATVMSAMTIVSSPLVALGQVPTEKSTLWEISGNGLTKPSYLFGTIHSICPEKLMIGKNQRKALDSVQQIYLEIDIDDLGTMVSAAGGIRRPGTASLKELMTPQEYRKVRNYFDKRGIPYWSISNLRPYMITQMITGNVSAREGCYASSSWEAMLVKTAKNRRLAVYGLEEPEEQFAVFDKMPMKQQIAGLIEAIDNPDKVREDTAKSLTTLNKLYDTQDIDQMYKLIDQVTFNNGGVTGVEIKADRSFVEALLDQRNRNWIPKISRIIQEKPTFFGVGAGHLGGRQGVIALLRDAGYTMKPLYDNRPAFKPRKSSLRYMDDNENLF